ncbi:uncharacterized protein BO72DRAFT_446940 [Aspergillus fijiensis CBS 313.89]|uniref:Uncharacterized protein n=1 Tax=Aspergillus fijiensis CBS 313.89 TaxID=1448319 RepID=A0A8G1W347_9EURO|nr:uncharacterized protein BO72DRAFT_446940 [Aspergillus fijiensis CBS 313.89]RAK78724.1 hypothetical protein BO72DRAFT_446940 [Aspergillus fijiensis CBS 313.89]
MARSVGRQIGLPVVGLALHLMIHGTKLPEPEKQQGSCHRAEDDTGDATPGDGIGAIGVIPTLEKVDWRHGCGGWVSMYCTEYRAAQLISEIDVFVVPSMQAQPKESQLTGKSEEGVELEPYIIIIIIIFFSSPSCPYFPAAAGLVFPLTSTVRLLPWIPSYTNPPSPPLTNFGLAF